MLVTSKDAAAVSGVSFVVFATVTAFGVRPLEGLALLFGVYRFMSMAIATCNTIGDSVGTVVVRSGRGSLPNRLQRPNTAECLGGIRKRRFNGSEVVTGNANPLRLTKYR